MLEKMKHYLHRNRLPSFASAICAVMMLVFLPLVFRNALFDINRVKADLMIAAVPVCSLLSAVSFAAARKRPALCREVKRICLILLVFAAAAAISSARCGFSKQVLFGLDGRRSGLLFLLACVGGFLVIVIGGLEGSCIRLLASASAAAVAVLGVLNAVGVDPFGFYVRMQKGQEHLFLSTIGNIDFFGCYLALMLPAAAGGWVFCGRRKTDWLYLTCSICITAGIAASRSDTALLAVQAGMLLLLVFSGESYAAMSRILFLWAFSFAALPIMYTAFQHADYYLPVTGIFFALCDRPLAWAASAMLFAVSISCVYAGKHGRKPLGIRRIAALSLSGTLVIAALLLAAIICFTVIYPDAEIGPLSSFLRFDDHWGTRRGFVYRCSAKALSGFSLADCLFGQGVDMTHHILGPYFDDPAMLAHGVFNDAHCQPLQYLLTTGLLGSASLIAFHVSLMISLARYAKHDSMICSYFAALCAYTLSALVSVSQPILIASYFAVCAAAVSRVQYFSAKEGDP